MITRRSTLRGLAAGAAAVAAGPLLAQDDRATVTIVVGAASSMDSTARLVAEVLREGLDRPVIVLSKLGAGARLAVGEVKRAAPDGRTLLFSSSGPLVIYPNIYTKLDYDTVKDLAPVAGVSSFDLGVAVSPSTGITDIHQFVDWAKAKGASGIEYGDSPGAGSSSHFCGISLAMATGLKLNVVHYKDSGPAMIDLASGRIPMLITGTQPLVQMHRAGKVRLLAVSGAVRSPMRPDIPTLKESGIDVVIQNTTGLYAPAKTPPAVVEHLHAVLMPLLERPDTRDRLVALGMVPMSLDGSQLAASLAQDTARYATLVKASGYVAEPL
jgi:tripartite-type tricarboxylate transporter receptor subunit TctC